MNNMNFEDKPFVSVIMGVRYQRQDLALLERSVKSILEQTYIDFEFIIQDDGSCQEAIALLSAMAEQDRRIRLIRGSGKRSLPEKLNECLKFASGDLIARMDDDDISSPERFEKQVVFLKEHPEVSFVGGNIKQMREGKYVGVRRLPEYPKTEDFLFTQPFVHPLLMFWRSALDKVGGYSEKKRHLLCEDYDLLLRLYEKKCYGANLQENLLEYTLPPYGKKNRAYRYCINEALTRWERFKALGLMPKAFFYALKPLVVGLLSPKLKDKWKACRTDKKI